MNRINKQAYHRMILMIFALLVICGNVSLLRSEPAAFRFASPDIIQSVTNEEDNTGSAFLTNGRLLYYKEWSGEDNAGIEVTEIDPNYRQDGRDWFNEKYQIKRILGLAKIVMDKEAFLLVSKTVSVSKLKKKTGLGGTFQYHMPESAYSEFYFEIKPPVHALDNACIRVRMIQTL